MSKGKAWLKVITMAFTATVGIYLLYLTLQLMLNISSGTFDMQSIIDIPL